MNRFIKAVISLMVLVGWLGTAQATTLSYHAEVDNNFTMYLSTSPTLQGTWIGAGVDWVETHSGTVELPAADTLYLQVHGGNWGANGGFISDFTLSDTNFHFANGAQYLLTNSNSAYWFVSASGYGASPNVVTGYGVNGSQPWGSLPGVDANAVWIWTDFYSTMEAYISTPIYSSAVPLPASLLLLGSGLAGLLGLGRKYRAAGRRKERG